MQQDHVNEDVAFVVCQRLAPHELGSHFVILSENLQREFKNLTRKSLVPHNSTLHMTALGADGIHLKPLLLDHFQPYH